MENEFKNKNILITGAAGSLGNWIIDELLKFHPEGIIAFDISEAVGFNLENKYRGCLNV